MSTAYWFVTTLLEPWKLLMLGLGVCVFWPKPAGTPRRRWLKTIYILTYLYCTPFIAYTSTWLLERPFPKIAGRPATFDAIVVLGGGSLPADWPGEPVGLTENSFRRCERAAELYHAGQPVPILITGGLVYATDAGPPVSRVMGDLLQRLGVAESDLIFEDASRTTAENARYSAAIIREQGWQRVALVSSATHLFRAEHLFRQQGIDVVPVGCQYRTDDFAWNVFGLLPSETALNRHDEAFHEFLGCVFLFVQGNMVRCCG